MTRWLGSAIDPYEEPWYRFSRLVSLLERHVQVPPGAQWLDIGCQIGHFIKFVQGRHDIVATGVDNFEDVVEVCKRIFKLEIKDPAEVLDGSWQYLFRWVDKGFNIENKFSFISALEVLEHMLDTDAFLRECREHLEDGGHLLISTPNINSLRNRVQVPLGVYPAALEYRNLIHHVRIYNAAKLRSHVEEHGFQLVATAGVNFLPARFLRHRIVRVIDVSLSNFFPSLCGDVIAIFRAVPSIAR